MGQTLSAAPAPVPGYAGGMPPILTSRANPRYKDLLARLRPTGLRRTHTLLLGAKLMEAWLEAPEATRARLRPVLALRREEAVAHPLEAGLETWMLGEGLMRELAEAGSPPDHALLMELGPEPEGPLSERVIGPWGIQDPGNLGAILRAAAAFGFQEALLGPGCADPFAPKALRGSMGAAFLMPLRRVERLEPDGGRWWALDGGPEATPLEGADLRAPLRLLVGNEGHGWRGTDLPEGVGRLAIPIQGVESLNAAVAAGIACFEAARRGFR